MKGKKLNKLELILTALRLRVDINTTLENILVEYNYINKRGRIIYNPGTWRAFCDFNKYEQDKFIGSILHEIGHFLVAPPQRRKRKDYGIPKSALTISGRKKKWDDEEQKAVLIEAELCEYVGVRFLQGDFSIKECMDSHEDWFEKEGKTIIKTVINLTESI